MDRKPVYCPFCGAWNGFPDGAVMLMKRSRHHKSPPFVLDTYVYWYHCLECGCDSPEAATEEEAYERAVFRFEPPFQK